VADALRVVTGVAPTPPTTAPAAAAPSTPETATPATETDADAAFDALLDAARSGNQLAWADLYTSVAGKLRSYAVAQGATEPDDLVGDVFVQVARNIARFKGTEANFRSWVFMIAHSRVVDARRAARRRPAPVALDEASTNLTRIRGTTDPAAETAAIDRMAVERVDEHLRDLTESQRQIMLLRYLGDLTLEEVASVTGRPLGAVKQLHRRALRSIRRNLDGRNLDRGVPG
jgi:RNA polymerase sigma-70 factor (ECF subfamily)